MNFNEFVLPPVNLEATNLADEWKLWLEAFGNYLDCYETQQRTRCCTKGDFVRNTGTGVQRLLSELPASKEKYEDVTTALTAHFRPKKVQEASPEGK